MKIIVAAMVLITILFLTLLRAGKEEDNFLEEFMRNRRESKNDKRKL